METKRPRLDDPKEFAIIREMYFDDHNLFNSDLDDKERLEREETKYRYKQQNSQ